MLAILVWVEPSWHSLLVCKLLVELTAPVELPVLGETLFLYRLFLDVIIFSRGKPILLIDSIRLKAEATAFLLVTGFEDVELRVEKQLGVGEDFWWAALPPPWKGSREGVVVRDQA